MIWFYSRILFADERPHKCKTFQSPVSTRVCGVGLVFFARVPTVVVQACNGGGNFPLCLIAHSVNLPRHQHPQLCSFQKVTPLPLGVHFVLPNPNSKTGVLPAPFSLSRRARNPLVPKVQSLTLEHCLVCGHLCQIFSCSIRVFRIGEQDTMQLYIPCCPSRPQGCAEVSSIAR